MSSFIKRENPIQMTFFLLDIIFSSTFSKLSSTLSLSLLRSSSSTPTTTTREAISRPHRNEGECQPFHSIYWQLINDIKSINANFYCHRRGCVCKMCTREKAEVNALDVTVLLSSAKLARGRCGSRKTKRARANNRQGERERERAGTGQSRGKGPRPKTHLSKWGRDISHSSITIFMKRNGGLRHLKSRQARPAQRWRCCCWPMNLKQLKTLNTECQSVPGSNAWLYFSVEYSLIPAQVSDSQMGRLAYFELGAHSGGGGGGWRQVPRLKMASPSLHMGFSIINPKIRSRAG